MAPITVKTNELLNEEIDTIFGRLVSYEEVVGVIVFDDSGIPVKSTLTVTETLNYARMGFDLVTKAYRGVNTIDPEEKLEIIRMRLIKSEVI